MMIGRAYHRHPAVLPAEPLCSRCGGHMHASQLSAPRAAERYRVGAPPRPQPLLPTWRCAACGLQQPRIEDAA